ncbi:MULTISPECIES: AAA family ATPase [unclassified Brevundimonas]|uniref:AAA family ATPase n=1 Tax=unclassified Brevundimonas TaxID=2622653 RepID=UPI0025BFBDEB|nr:MULTISPECIES: AAA family ATPase [unclassified Brevundimonas]
MTEKPFKPVRLEHVELRGFKSIGALSLDLSKLDLLIGPNGAGKSNLIDFLRFLGFMLSSESGLANFVGLAGGASVLLHGGPKQTREIEAHLRIRTGQGVNDYAFRLGHASGDTLIFLEERCRFSANGRKQNPNWIDLGSGHKFPQLMRAGEEGGAGKTRQTLLHLLRRIAVYQFHDTSAEAPMKQLSPVEDWRYLRSDGRNLAAFLLEMRSSQRAYYDRIVETLRLVAPYFDDFVLEPEYGRVLLRWREIGSNLEFGPGQISDGTLRAIGLLSLLLQSPDTMPSMIILDEPELGLHPYAIRIIAGAIKAVSETRQCLVATQSPQFLNAFEPDNVVVVERKQRGSTFTRLSQDSLKTWLDEYQLAELWDMNLLGGRPEPLAAE